MCTYQTTTLPLDGSAKGTAGWFGLTDASVYVDHPVHLGAGHAVLIDLRAPAHGPAARVAIELDAASARALAETILRTLEATPAGLLEATPC